MWMCKGWGARAANFCDSRRPISIKREIARRFSSLRSFQYTLEITIDKSICRWFIQFATIPGERWQRREKVRKNIPAGFQVGLAAPELWDRLCATLSPTLQGRCPLGTRTRRRRPNSPGKSPARNHLRTRTRENSKFRKIIFFIKKHFIICAW